MANRPHNIWAKAAAGSPGTNIARAQQSRWTGIPNEAIMRLVEDKIGSMLEGISGAAERNAAAQMQLDLQKKLIFCQRHELLCHKPRSRDRCGFSRISRSKVS